MLLVGNPVYTACLEEQSSSFLLLTCTKLLFPLFSNRFIHCLFWINNQSPFSSFPCHCQSFAIFQFSRNRWILMVDYQFSLWGKKHMMLWQIKVLDNGMRDQRIYHICTTIQQTWIHHYYTPYTKWWPGSKRSLGKLRPRLWEIPALTAINPTNATKQNTFVLSLWCAYSNLFTVCLLF